LVRILGSRILGNNISNSVLSVLQILGSEILEDDISNLIMEVQFRILEMIYEVGDQFL